MKRTVALVVALTIAFSSLSHSQEPAPDYAKAAARPSQEWVRDAVIYQIFPRQYSQKGDFNSITADLDRIEDLGVTVIWLMPVHPIGELKKKGTIGSPYAVRDFYAVNPDYGTEADLKRLVAEAHKRGLKVIIDIVANHTAWDSVMMKNKAFYTTNEKGEVVPPNEDWTDVADLNYDNPALREYMIDMLKFWVREYNMDGFRCDVAGAVPTDFWEKAREEVDKVNKDTLWLAEASQPDLMIGAFNVDYAWPGHSAIDAVMHGSRPASFIRETWLAEQAKFPQGTLHMRFTDNHDERRAIARFGEKGALAAHALVFLMDGVPLVYNGMEVGDTTESGFPALFEKMPIFWDIGVRRPEFKRFYEAMIDLRKGSEALRRGRLEWLRNSGEDRIVSFIRRGTDEDVVAVINLSSTRFAGFVEAAGDFEDVTPSIGDSRAGRTAALPAVTLAPWEFRVFRRR